jgi:hypothetical protein
MVTTAVCIFLNSLVKSSSDNAGSDSASTQKQIRDNRASFFIFFFFQKMLIFSGALKGHRYIVLILTISVLQP